MRLGVIRANLLIAEARSLKDKRRVIKSLKDRLSSHFNVSVAEVGAQDLWQRAEIGVSLVATDAKRANAQLQKIEQFIRNHPGASPIDLDIEIIHLCLQFRGGLNGIGGAEG